MTTPQGAQAEIMDILRVIRDEGRKIPGSNERLASSIDNYSTAMVEYQERARVATRRNRIIVSILACISIVLLTGVVVITAVMFATVHKLEKSDAAAQETRDRVLSCTDPAGECAKQSQAQQVAAIGQLIESNLNVAVCAPAGEGIADAVQRKAAIASCISALGA